MSKQHLLNAKWLLDAPASSSAAASHGDDDEDDDDGGNGGDDETSDEDDDDDEQPDSRSKPIRNHTFGWVWKGSKASIK